jgi:hypothetical protein
VLSPKSSPRNQLNHNKRSPGFLSLGDATASLLEGIAQPAPARSPAKVRSARSRNRAEAWAYDLARQRDYALAMTKSEAARAEVDAAYEADRAAGPDFTRYHAGSGFRDLLPEHQLDRSDRHRILVAFDVIRTGMFRHCRVPRRRTAAKDAGRAPVLVGGKVIEQAAAPSRNYRAVLDVLLRYAVRFGRVYPKLETIAREACVSVRTVQNAIDWLRRFGFVDRIRRLVRERGRLGAVRSRQTSNAYRVGFPTGVGRLAQSVFRQIAYATGSSAPTTRNTCHPSGSPPSPMTTDRLGEGASKLGFQLMEPGCRRIP